MAELGDGEAKLHYEVGSERDGAVLLELDGELDLSNIEELETSLADVIERVSSRLVVDLDGLRFADSSAIALWVKWAKTVPEIEIRNPSPLVRRVVETMGLRGVLGMT